jgi:hypothetical protein
LHWYVTNVGAKRCPVVDNAVANGNGGIMIPIKHPTKPTYATLPPGICRFNDEKRNEIEGNQVGSFLRNKFMAQPIVPFGKIINATKTRIFSQFPENSYGDLCRETKKAIIESLDELTMS